MRVARALVGAATRLLRLTWLPASMKRFVCVPLETSVPALTTCGIEDLVRLARSGSAGELVLGNRRSAKLEDVLALADRPQFVGPVALALERSESPPGVFSKLMYEIVVLNQAGDAESAQVALIAARRRPELLSREHANAIVLRALRIAQQPLDPYDPHPLRVAAAITAAGLVADRDDLSTEVQQALVLPPLRPVASAAIQSRRNGAEVLLGDVLRELSPSAPEAQKFTHSCNQNYSAAVTAPTAAWRTWWAQHRSAVSRTWRRSRWLGTGVGIVVFCALAGGAGLLIDAAVVDLPNTLRADSGASLGALALLVAVHLVSAELAADRLPGPIARATSVPPALVTSYVIAAAALVLGQVSENAVASGTRSAITYGLAAGFAMSFVYALVQLLGRIDTASATTTFVRRRQARARAAGQRLGRMHAASKSGSDALALVPWIKITLSPPIADRRIAIQARNDGWLSVSERQIRKLIADGWWKGSAARVWLSAQPGAKVERGTEVAAITAGDDGDIPRRRAREVRRLLSERSLVQAESTAEVVGILVELMTRQAAAGNEAGGHRIADSAVGLLETHLDGIEVGRANSGAGGPVPALRTAAISVSYAFLRSDHPGEREVLHRFVRRLLPACGPGDPFCITLLAELKRVAPTRPESADALLWELGVRTAHLADPVLTRSWLMAFASLAPDSGDAGSPNAIDVAARVTALACYTDADVAHELLRALVPRLDLDSPEDVVGLLRIGAASVRSGALSVSLEVALECRGLDIGIWDQWASDHNLMRSEVLRNEMYGAILGPDPQRVLQRFLAFAKNLPASVT